MQFSAEQKNIKQAATRIVVNAALNNSGSAPSNHLNTLLLLFMTLFRLLVTDSFPGVMRHGLNAAYYANQNQPIRAIQEVGAAVRDAVTGSRK
jgi:hypothetical protein